MESLRHTIELRHPISGVEISVPYILRISTRARRLSMKIGMDRGLEVIVPDRFNHKRIPGFMEEHAEWVIKNLQKRSIKKQKAAENQIKDGSVIHIIGKPKTIRILSTRQHKPFVKEARALKYDGDTAYYDNEEIIVFMPKTDVLANDSQGEIKKALEKHLRAKAKKIFQTRTAEIAETMGLSYNRVTVKAQKTRWGSCSRDKNLNFNWRLILANPETMDSIIVHELAHLVHLNHGRRFYDLVGKYSPDHKLHSKKLKDTVFPV